MSNTYKLGTSVKVEGAFTDEDGDDLDPTTVTAMVKAPDGVEASYVYGVDAVVIKDSIGHYHMWIETALGGAGTYAYRWKGETDASPDPIDVANEDEFEVEESAFTNP